MTAVSRLAEKPIHHEGNAYSLGEILIEENLITFEQLQKALFTQENEKKQAFLGQILIDQGVLSEEKLHYVLKIHKKWPLIGDLLIKNRIIDKKMLISALRYQKEKGCRLGEALIQLNFVSEQDLKRHLSRQLNIPYIDLNRFSLDPSLKSIIPYQYAKKNLIVPLEKNENTITLAVDDPTNWAMLREINAFTGHNVRVVTATKSDLRIALNKISGEDLDIKVDSDFDHESDHDSHIKYIHINHPNKDFQLHGKQIVKGLINIAIRNFSTDIHIEAHEREPLVRFRIDGILQELPLDSMHDELTRYYKEIISHLKVLGRMDISEKRRPQDGSFRLRGTRNQEISEIDFRLSVVPGYFGENAVLRILDPQNAPKSFDALGFSEKVTQKFNNLLENKTGIILITGATGSGKSTSLYGALMTLRKPGVKILTAEDPIEYVYNGLTQCQVSKKVGNTFADFIRSFLRQDPDIIMVGEIRDLETAEMAFRAAQTGHLVLSTLHTNNAIDSISRLLSLNVEPHQLISSLLGVLSQRLIRRICPHCAMPDTPPAELIDRFFEEVPEHIQWMKGKGCLGCNYTGYKGRMAVGELWVIGARERSLIGKKMTIENIRQVSDGNFITMMDDLYSKISNGETTLEEIVRAIPPQNMYKYGKLANSNKA